MTQAQKVWAEAAELFDALAPLPPAERQRRIQSQTVAPEVRRWLDELLQAHDSDRSLIIDRKVDALARALAPNASMLAAEEYAGQQFGPWLAEQEIGRGGMGVVLIGRRADGQFEMRVAIKLLDPDRFSGATREALSRELRLLASLDHPGIARLIDGGLREDGVPYLVMEYIDGEPLTAWSARVAPDLDARVQVLITVASAVAHCHSRLVVHGDIKPGNVLIDNTGRTRLLDFGIASRLTDSSEQASTGWCSPGYAAPERLRGAAPAIAEDVFALGALLYTLLTGAGIRRAPEQTRILAGQESSGRVLPPPPSERFIGDGRAGDARRLKGDLDAIVMRALAADAADRYPTVEALIADLEAWQQRRPVQARSAGPAYRIARWIERNRVLASALMLGSLALIGGSGLALWQADRARDSALAARSAQASAEQSAARADTVNRFLLDLFRARIPNLPPDQLPTTRQLMDQGIERARDASSGPPELRAELLTSLAEILAARRQLDEADALLDEAAALHNEEPAVEDALRLRMAVARADLARNRNMLDQVEHYTQAAIALYRELRPDDPKVLELQRNLVRTLMQREQFELAEQAALALQKELALWPDTEAIALALAGDLAIIAGSTGRHSLAVDRFERILEMKLALGHEPLSLASTEINLAELAKLQFRYDDALVLYRAVLERLAPYTEVPRSVRATAWTGLSNVARTRGDFDAAAEWMNRAAEEWIRLLDLPSIDDDFFIHYYGARLDADRGAHRASLARLDLAIQRLSAVEEGPKHRIGALMADRARTLCQLGELQAAGRALVEVSDWPGEPVRRAENEARAVCALADPAAEIDPAWVSEAHIEYAVGHSGDVSEIARLEILRARLLRAAGRAPESVPLLASAAARLDAGGVRPDHPLRAALRRLGGG